MILYSLSSCLEVGKRQQMMHDTNEAKNEVAVAATATQNEAPKLCSRANSTLSLTSSVSIGIRANGSSVRC